MGEEGRQPKAQGGRSRVYMPMVLAFELSWVWQQVTFPILAMIGAGCGPLWLTITITCDTLHRRVNAQDAVHVLFGFTFTMISLEYICNVNKNKKA